MRKTNIGYLVIISFLAVTCIAARPYLDITGPDFRPLPLALVGVQEPTDPAAAKAVKEFNQVVKNDLEISGLFKLIDPKTFLVKSETEGMADADIKWQQWADTGAEALIKGKTSAGKDGAVVVINLRLYEIGSSKSVLDKTYSIRPDKARETAHVFCDDVVGYFTGQPGIFRTRIVFVKKQGGAETINIIDMDGANENVLVSNGSINLLPSWGQDGKSIFYTSFINHNPDLYEYFFSDNHSTVVSKHPGLNIGAQVSPDGKNIAITLSRDDNSEIYLIDREGKIMQRLTSDWGIDSSSTWSPDGKKISFVSTRSGNPNIYMMNMNGSDQVRLTFKGNYNQTPRWSPKGDKIAFTARDERNVFDLFVLDPQSKEVKRLTQDQGNNEEPSWSPNGKYITFTSTRGGSSQIFIMNADGTNQRRITSGKGDYATPAWGPYTSVIR